LAGAEGGVGPDLKVACAERGPARIGVGAAKDQRAEAGLGDCARSADDSGDPDLRAAIEFSATCPNANPPVRYQVQTRARTNPPAVQRDRICQNTARSRPVA